MYKDTIEIEAKSFSINLQLDALISVATGYSSTGKTFLIKMLELLQETSTKRIVKSNISVEDIVVCRTKNDIDLLLSNKDKIKEKTIFIDRYDYLHSCELNKFILSGNNRVIIMSHTFYDELNLNVESFIIIKYNKEKRLFYTERVLDHLSIDEEII